MELKLRRAIAAFTIFAIWGSALFRDGVTTGDRSIIAMLAMIAFYFEILWKIRETESSKLGDKSQNKEDTDGDDSRLHRKD